MFSRATGYEEMKMTEYLCLSLIAVGIIVYLLYSLLRPEKF